MPVEPQSSLTPALKAKLPRLSPVEEFIVLRVSARSKRAFENQEDTGMAVFGHLPDVVALSELPGSILDPGAESIREEYGFVPINTDDVSPYASTDRPMGYMGSKGQTVFLFIMDSAIQEQIHPPHDPLGQNAFTELVIRLTQALRPVNVRFAFWSRLTRNSMHGARITEAIRRSRGMSLWDGNTRVDLHSPGGRVIAGVNSGVSESDAANLKEATLVGRLNKAKDGLWPLNPKSLPLGYRFKSVIQGGEIITLTGMVEPDPNVRPVIEALAALRGQGANWKRVGEVAAELEVPLRSVKGRTFADLKPSQQARSARRLFTPKKVRAYRTGRYRLRIKGVIPGLTEYRGHFPTFEDENDNIGYFEFELDFGLPAGGWGVTDECWDAIEELNETRPREKTGGAATAGHRTPLSGLGEWSAQSDDSEVVRKVLPKNGYYVTRQRRTDVTGQWCKDDTELVATVNQDELHRAVGIALESALLTLSEEPAELWWPQGVDITTEGKAELMRLEEKRREVERRRSALEDLAIDAKIEGDQAEADRYRRHVAELSEQVERINGAIERTRRQIDLDLEKGQHKVADLRIPAVVAGALQSVDSKAPAQLGEACQRIIRDFVLDPSDREGFAEWSASIAIPLTSGEHANLTIHGTVTNRKDGAWRNRRGRKRGLADLRFEQSLSIDDVARTANIGRHRAVSEMRKELSSIIDSPGLRSAAIDCPVEETQHEISNLLSGDAPKSPFAEHLRDTYQADTKWPHCWAVDHHKTSRLVINLILDQPDPSQGVDIAAASLALDVTPKELRRLANPKNKERPPTLRQEKNKLFLFQCPHEDCALPSSRRFVTHALITPETNASGLICTGCQRMPHEAYAGIRFPAAYLDLWAGPLGTGGSAPALASEDATVLGHASDYRPPMRAASKPTLRTIGEAAKLLGVSESSLRRWTKQGLVSCTWVVAKGGEQRMFSDEDLDNARAGLRAKHGG